MNGKCAPNVNSTHRWRFSTTEMNTPVLPADLLAPLLPAGPLPLQLAPLAAFEHALRRAGRGAPGDEDTALPDAAVPPPPLQAAPDAPAPAPRAVLAPDAVVSHLRALQLTEAPAAAFATSGTSATVASVGQWQLQWPGADAPVLHVQRGAEGGLHLVLSTAPEQQRSTPLAALRERLQARGHSLQLRTQPGTERRRPEEPV